MSSILLVLSTYLLLTEAQGSYATCPDASFQSVTQNNPVHCKSVCHRRDFLYFQLSGRFCFCSNSNTCYGFDVAKASFPIILAVSATDGFISESVQVDARIELADLTYNGMVNLELDGVQTSVTCNNGIAQHSLLKTYLKPGRINIKASASNDGLTINNSTTITIHCKPIIGDQLPSTLMESGVAQMLSIQLIAGYNVNVKVMTDNLVKYSFLIMDPKVLVSGRLFTSTSETSPNTLYYSDTALGTGYIYGVQLRASYHGTIQFQVRCGPESLLINSTALTLTKGVNRVLLAPLYVETRACFAAVQTDWSGRLYTRNMGPYAAEYKIADMSLSVYTSQPREILVPVHWNSPGTHDVIFLFTSFEETLESSTAITVLDKVEGLKMSVKLSDVVHEFNSGLDNVLNVTVFDALEFTVTVDKGTSVNYTWDPEPGSLTFNTLTFHTITVTADNLLNLPQTVKLTIPVTDQRFLLSELEVSSEVELEREGEVFLLTGVGVKFKCDVTGGTGLTMTLDPGDNSPLTLTEYLYNKDSTYTLSYTYTYTNPLQTFKPRVCVSNTVSDRCVVYQYNVTVVQRVGKPKIDIPAFVERGQVITVESDVVTENYLWTKNTPKVDMALTETGLEFIGSVDVSVNNKRSQSFYFNKIGTFNIGLYVYNMMSWEYTQRTVFVESQVGNIPVQIIPNEYATTGRAVRLILNCPPANNHNVTVNTTETLVTFECLQKQVEYNLSFSSPGEHFIVVTTYNNISFTDRTYTLIVQDVVDIGFSVASVGISPNDSVAVDSLVSFMATAHESFVPQPDLLVSWNVSGSATILHLLESEEEVINVSSVSHLFNTIGEQTIICCMKNNVSRSCAQTVLHVLTPVSGLVITYANSSYVIAPGQAVHLRVSVREGSRVKVTGRIGEEDMDVSMSNKQGTLQHVFTEAGVYPVTMTAYNEISSVQRSLPSFIYVQHEVQGIRLIGASSGKQEMDKSTLRTEEVYLDVYIGGGTNATVRCNFGDGPTSIVTAEVHHTPFNVSITNSEQTIRCKYKYKTTGIFSTSVRVSNSISYINIPASDLPVFTVEVPIEGCVINIPDTVRRDQSLELQYTLTAGSNVLHEWFIDGERFNDTAYQPQSEGALEITVVVVNNLNTVSVSKNVSVESKLLSVKLAENLGSYHKLSSPVKLKLELTPEAEFNVQYIVDMGDGTVYSTSDVSHHYNDIGIYKISVAVKNSLSTVRLTKSLNLQDEILRVMIKGSFMVLERQLSSFNADVFKRSTSKLEENVHYVWKIDGVVQEQDAPDISILLETTGTYVLSLTVYNDIGQQSVSETLVVMSNNTCQPPDAHIAGGQDIVVRTVDTVTLEAVMSTNCNNKHAIKWSVLTLDRVTVKNFTYSRSKTLTFHAALLDPGSYIIRMVVYVVESPDLYRSDEVLVTVGAVHIIPKMNYPTFTTTNTKETLEISLRDSILLNSSLTIDSFQFIWSCKFKPIQPDFDPCEEQQLSDTANISVHFNVSGFANLSAIILLDDQVVGSPHIVLNVTNFVVPLVKITVNGLHELSPNKRTVASLHCSQRGVLCFNPAVYWIVTRVSHTQCATTRETEPSFSLTAAMTTTGLNQRNLVVRSGVLGSGGMYKLEGCVWQGVCSGEMLEFKCGPSLGSCHVQLKTGQLVEVVCKEWVSSSGQLQYHVTYQSESYPVVVYSGPQSTSQFILPAGEQSVSVAVLDSTGARTQLQPVLLNVTSDTKSGINTTELLNSNDYQLVLQIINSDLNKEQKGSQDSTAWGSELREVLTGINNTGDVSTYLSSLSSTVANFLNTNANEEGLQLFIEFLEMLLSFLEEVLAGKYTLPDNSLDVILEILNRLLSLTQQLFSSGETEVYLTLLNRAYSMCDDVTGLVLTINLNERVAGEEDLVQKQQFVGVLGRKLEPSGLQGEVFEAAGYRYDLPHSLEYAREKCLQGHMVVYDENPYGVLDPVSSHVSSLTLRYCNGTAVSVYDTQEDITITLPINDTKGTTESVFSILTHKRVDNSTTNQYKVEKQANIHRIGLEDHGALNVQITCMNTMTSVPLSVIIGVDSVPTTSDFLKSGLVEKSSTLSFHFTAEQLAGFNASELVVSVTNYENPALPYVKQTPPNVRKYSVQYWYSQCLFRRADGWSGEGCSSSEYSSPTQAVCLCSHLTLFASRHFVTPNKLDIGTILTTRRLEDGHVILTFTCTVLFVYLVTLTILVKLDISRGSSSSVIYLEDNYVRDKQGYLLRIVTGSQPNAGTTAKVSVKLYGKQRESSARLLSAQRPLFASKSRESFVLKFPTSLGKIHHIHIWHDNSGKDPSWFLESVTITDLNTNRTRYFPCHEWLAVEEGDGDIEKMIPSSKSPYKTKWDAFISNASFSEHHLWASIFKDHTYANFSKPQRLTVCFTLVFVAMATNVAFWKPALDTTFNFTIFNIGTDILTQGVLSGAIVLPFVVGVIILFRRSQTRVPLLVYPDSTKVLSQSSLKDAQLAAEGGYKRKAGLTPVIEELSPPRNSFPPENPTSQFWCEGGISLPWWCGVLGWILCFIAITCSVVVSTFYGIQFGNNKSLQWLSSLVVSLIESIFISQPLIVVGCGIYASLSFGKKKKARPISKADTMTLNYMLPRNFTTKAYEGLARLKAFRFRSTKPPPHKATILAAREECMRRKELSELGNSLLLHVYLLIVVLLAANSSIPDRGHWNVRGVTTAFSGKGRESIHNVTTPDEWFSWMENVFTQSAYWEPNYLDLRGFTRDGGFYRLGNIRLRMQQKDVCPNGHCVRNWSSQFVHSYYSDKIGFATAGTFTWYDESGYIVYLPSTQDKALSLLQSLKSSSWISKATSAVFVEMSLYNPSTNTFVDVKFITEFPDFCLAQSTVVVSPLHVLFRNSTQEVLLFLVLGVYVIGLVLLLREIFHTYVEHSSTPSLTYNTVLAIFMIVSFATHLTRILEVNKMRNRIIEKATYIDMNTLNFLTTTMMVSYGMSSFFLIMRSIAVFKFFRLINIFHTVLYIALSNVLHFSIFVVVTILIFALTGMILFGSHVLVFSSFTKAVMSLLAVLTHNMHYVHFQQVAPVIAPIYFIVYYGVTFIVLCRIVVAIFIRTMFELRKSKADHHQVELATFLWNKFQDWLWEEEEEEKKKRSKTPNYDVVGTKVEEMEAFVNALLRTVEASIGRRGDGSSPGPPGSLPGSGFTSRPASVPDSRPASVPESVSTSRSRPTSVPRKIVSGSGKRRPILKSAQSMTRPDPRTSIKSEKNYDFTLEDYKSPPISPKKSRLNSPKTWSPKQSARPIVEPTFSFITSESEKRKPISQKKRNTKTPRGPKLAVPKSETPSARAKARSEEPKHPPEGVNSPADPPVTSTSSTLSKNKLEAFPVKSVPLEKDLPDTIRMMTRPLSPPNLPTHIQTIKNKRAELPPLQATTTLNQPAAAKPGPLAIKKPPRYSKADRPIVGGNTILTPVEHNQPAIQDTCDVKQHPEKSGATAAQESRIRKVISDIKTIGEVMANSTMAKESESSPTKESADPETPNQLQDDAFYQLREHLQRGDTCPDVIIKSLLTEIDRPQTTPGEIQKQTAIIAEHLMKAGWDDQPFLLQREHTELSLFSLLTRESTQVSDWPSISRESTIDGGKARAGRSSSRQPDCEDQPSEIPDNVSALIRRALAQVSGGAPPDAQETPVSGHRSGQSSSGSDDTSPTGPPEPIVTENTFIFARDNW